MREFRDYETRDIFNFVNSPMEDLSDLNSDQINIINENLRKNVMYYLSNFSVFLPTKNPQSVYINIRIGSKPIHKLAEGMNNYYCIFRQTFLEFMEIFSPPCEIFIDFFGIASSDTREDECLIHPSIPTHFNKKTIYYDIDDVAEIKDEFVTEGLAEKILERHHLVRTLESENSLVSSNVKLNKLVCMWAYLNPM